MGNNLMGGQTESTSIIKLKNNYNKKYYWAFYTEHLSINASFQGVAIYYFSFGKCCQIIINYYPKSDMF